MKLVAIPEGDRKIFFEELKRRARDEFPTMDSASRLELHLHLTSALMLNILTSAQVDQIYDDYIFPVQKKEALFTESLLSSSSKE